MIMTDRELETELIAAVVENTLRGDEARAKVAQEALRDFQKRQRDAIPPPRTVRQAW